MNRPLVEPRSSENDPQLQDLITFFNETLGFCPNSVLTMHHRPAIAKTFIALNMAVMQNEGKVSSALKRLVGYISSMVAGCNYCQAHTIRAAERYGALDIQLENIWRYKSHDSFSDAERAALDFAWAASVIPNAVNDQIGENLHKYYNDGEIVEILGVISLFGFLNRWNDSMASTLEIPAAESGQKWLKKSYWKVGKH